MVHVTSAVGVILASCAPPSPPSRAVIYREGEVDSEQSSLGEGGHDATLLTAAVARSAATLYRRSNVNTGRLPADIHRHARQFLFINPDRYRLDRRDNLTPDDITYFLIIHRSHLRCVKLKQEKVFLCLNVWCDLQSRLSRLAVTCIVWHNLCHNLI